MGKKGWDEYIRDLHNKVYKTSMKTPDSLKKTFKDTVGDYSKRLNK